MSSYTAEHRYLLKSKKWQKWTSLGEFLLIHITRSHKKSVYKWDWKFYWKALAQRRISCFFGGWNSFSSSWKKHLLLVVQCFEKSMQEWFAVFFVYFFNRQFKFPGHGSSGCDSQCCPDVKFILQKWSTTDLVFVVHKTLAINRLYIWHFISILCNVWAEIYKFYMRWHSLVYILESFNKAWVL